MDKGLKAAVLGAQKISSPKSPLGSFPELAKLYATSFQLPQSTQATGVGVNQAQIDVEAQRRAAAAARAAAAHAASLAKQKEEDLSNPNKYRVVKGKDGGFDFFAPDGSQVDIATLTQRTGTDPAEWLKDSKNPIDIQYTEDAKNLQDFGKALLSGDAKTVNKYQTAKPELQQYAGRGGYDKLIGDFQNAYQRFYVPRSQNPAAWGYAPADQPFVGSPYGGQ